MDRRSILDNMFNVCRGCAPIQCRKPTEDTKQRLLRDIRKTYESLSPDEQELIDNDTKGTRSEIEENSEFIAKKLRELDEQSQELNDNAQIAYKQAIKIETEQESGEEYIRSESFRLMFLRAEEFNAQMSARRIARYFEHKKELFGYEALARKIKQSDLSDKDLEVMSSGCFCSTGATDMHGRLIVYIDFKLRDHFSCNNMRRAVFYLFQILEDQEDWQKRGLVLVGDLRDMGVSKPSSVDRLHPYRRMILRGMPFRIACTHACYNSTVVHIVIRLALVVIPKSVATRIVTQHGRTAEEIFSGLLSYGINPDDLPLTSDWKFRNKLVVEFLDTLREKEESEDLPLAETF